MLFIFVKTGVW